MTEYEIRDLMESVLSGSTSVVALVISVISAYLLVSWVVGSRLTRPQVIWINLLFITFSSMMIFRLVTGYRVAMHLQQNMLQLNAFIGTRITPEIIAGISCIFAASVFGSLKFMWDVRHPKT